MSIAEALNANRACSAPWIKDAVLRPVTLEPPSFALTRGSKKRAITAARSAV